MHAQLSLEMFETLIGILLCLCVTCYGQLLMGLEDELVMVQMVSFLKLIFDLSRSVKEIMLSIPLLVFRYLTKLKVIVMKRSDSPTR